MKTLTALIVSFLIMGVTGNLWAADSKQTVAGGAAYLDVATGHRYLKNPDGTYAEFTKKGKLFRKSVPNDLPLLTTNKYIRQMGNNGVAKWDNPSISSGLGYSSNISTVSYDGKTLTATGNAYFDTATGHKYTRNPDGTYTEFTRKGKLFRKSVPNDLPLLTTNKYIRDLEESCYLLYVRTVNRQPRIMVLPSTQEHPQGWKCRVLISMK
ncbi:hypothetical protein [Desulfospira joergensenii]|uniref:hypothetical protein n=1 Tax=Desulfospira joergensenii TaxID=53329 RepID=UPI0003B52ABA|nr:hypothetical protein [Desulfospira joergensenii]